MPNVGLAAVYLSLWHEEEATAYCSVKVCFDKHVHIFFFICTFHLTFLMLQSMEAHRGLY